MYVTLGLLFFANVHLEKRKKLNNIGDIFKFINFVADKYTNGYLSPEEVSSALANGQVSLWNHYMGERQKGNELALIALKPFSRNSSVTSSSVGFAAYPLRYAETQGIYYDNSSIKQIVHNELSYALNSVIYPIEQYPRWIEGQGGVTIYPKEYSVLRMNGEFVLKQQNTDNHPYPYLPPQTVHKNSLIELPNYFALDANTAPIGAFSNPFSYLETLADATNNGFFLEYPAPSQYYIALPLAKYVWDMHELGESPTGSWGTDPIYSGVPGPSYVGISRFADYSIYIFDEADEYAPSGFGRAFLPNATYNLGLRYYDYALRSCGNQEIEKVKIQDYNPFDREVTESITVAITGANTAPDWAKYFAVTLSKNNICQNFINFTPTIIKIARKTNEGIIYVTSDWFNKIESDELYGLAIPLDALQSYGQGYSYSEGDYIRLDVATGTPITYSSSISYNAAIIGVVNGHIIANAPDIDPVLFTLSGYLSSQYDKINSPVYDGTLLAPISASPSLMTASFRQSLAYATIYQQKQADINNYEVAAFGYCNVVSGTNRLDSF